MNNVKMKVEKNILTITVDLGEKGQPSASGKSVVIASTQGNVTIPSNTATIYKMGLNVYIPTER